MQQSTIAEGNTFAPRTQYTVNVRNVRQCDLTTIPSATNNTIWITNLSIVTTRCCAYNGSTYHPNKLPKLST